MSFDEQEERVKFLTFHSCKGLEFPFVAIPSGKIITSKQTDEEEMKLMYVAMTRSTSQLLLTAIAD